MRSKLPDSEKQEENDIFSAETFTKNMLSGPPSIELWDMLSDVAFWIKDHRSRFVWINDTLAKQAQLPKSEVIGKCDVDCFHSELAHNYMMDDYAIVAGGGPILNKPELVMTPEGGVEWRQTTKYPVLNKEGKPFGSKGISRKMESDVPLPQEYAALGHIITHASENLAKRVTVQDLAKEAHLSVSTLERYFQAHLRISPNELLRKIKMNRAFLLLTSSALNVSEIAGECGYESLSSFSRAFRRYIGMTPLEYRQNHQSRTERKTG